MQLLDLSGLTLPISSSQRIELSQSYSEEKLTKLFIQRWIPHLECQECGRHTYCKFTQPHPHRPGRLLDIQCGVVVEVVRNYVKSTFSTALSLSKEELQQYIDASFHLVEFVYKAELYIGSMIDSGYLKYLAEDQYRVAMFGYVSQLREDLNKYAGALREIKAFRTKKTVILVEGASEKWFLERIRETGLASFIDLDVENYEGRGNRKPTFLRLLATRLKNQGYELFIQGDCDGQNDDIFQALVNKGIVKKEYTFQFRVDFETSFHPKILLIALHELGLLKGIDKEKFMAKVSSNSSESVVKILKDEFSISVDKTELADELANIFINTWYRQDYDELWNSEIRSFLDCIQKLP
jgi:hypothetical protein